MLAANSTRTILEADVDYITASARDADGKRAFERIGFWELKKEEARGNEVKTYSAHGGEGLRCGSAEFMSHPDYYMLRFSSHLAAERWKEIAFNSTNVSRIDLQATVRLTPSNDNLAEIVERRMKRFKQERNRRLELELRRNDVKGKTLYSGSRKSDCFARLYDKGKESKLPDYQGAWRLECQYSNRPARDVAYDLLTHEDIGTAVLGHVATYYKSRGAVVIDSTRIRLSRKIRPVDDQNPKRRYSWLERQVAPMVKSEYERGHLNRVLDALGITQAMLSTLDHATNEEE